MPEKAREFCETCKHKNSDIKNPECPCNKCCVNSMGTKFYYEKQY